MIILKLNNFKHDTNIKRFNKYKFKKNKKSYSFLNSTLRLNNKYSIIISLTISFPLKKKKLELLIVDYILIRSGFGLFSYSVLK